MNVIGKTALITGASKGIGRAIALELARSGIKRIILVARNRDRLAKAAADIEAHGTEAIPLSLDLSAVVDVDINIAKAWRDYGPIHLLVNSAGIAHQTPFLKAQAPQMQAELTTNLMGVYAVTHVIAKRMVEREEGAIVNVSSLMGKVAAPTMSTYSATKFALMGFTQALRSELSEHNVQVVALLPTLTKTDMVNDFARFKWVKSVTPEQVAQALVRGLRQGSSEVLVGWQSHATVWLNRLMPGVVERLVRVAAPPPNPVSTLGLVGQSKQLSLTRLHRRAYRCYRRHQRRRARLSGSLLCR
ncbi:MAG: SDR family NAD(P)-dependent oxidoreductase [Cyanobacteria bacterium P01_E01_bin.34]